MLRDSDNVAVMCVATRWCNTAFDQLRKAVIDAVKCHFDSHEMPQMVRLHVVRDEVLPV